MCYFVGQLQYMVEQHLAMFEGMNEVGDSVQRVDSLITDLNNFQLESKVSTSSCY